MLSYLGVYKTLYGNAVLIVILVIVVALDSRIVRLNVAVACCAYNARQRAYSAPALVLC